MLINTVGKIIYEDYSAKTFMRPEWSQLVNEIKKTKGKNLNFIIFTKWDRFSRNTMDGYNMINFLTGYGIIPIAIEQPLDLTVPEQKLMLAVYLPMPEVENDRRGLNVKYGMRRARKGGRWMGPALPGYKNKVRENGVKYIAPDGLQAKLMTWVFESIAKDIYPTEHIWALAKRQGLKCSRVSFWNAVRNPCYCGKIIVPKFGDEDMHLVAGLHEPLVSEKIFYQAQDAMDGRKRNQYVKVRAPEDLSLRGFLICHKCGRILTGSASQGRHQLYYYYHCKRPCNVRFRCDAVNHYFEGFLKNFVPRPGMAQLFRQVVCDTYDDSASFLENDRSTFIKKITDYNLRITRARELLLNDTISSDEYKQLKNEAEEGILRAEAEIKELDQKIQLDRDIYAAVDESLESLKTYPNYF
ncbi:recombinase family protein [Pedobacter ginsengisoli]|uniref:Recombinase family protein n=1 Tax=Pedobacter ginsengisoli TaxID=363852 RepID=A0A2D1U6D9_9SPHI|nr:recombinase family protein [Pedobacter ginsengisoli]ATP57165.1 recombinase family protein [Pedobacter ginsengisoli]